MRALWAAAGHHPRQFVVVFSSTWKTKMKQTMNCDADGDHHKVTMRIPLHPMPHQHRSRLHNRNKSYLWRLMSKIRSLTLISLKTTNSSLAAYNATCTGIVLQPACSAVSPSSLPNWPKWTFGGWLKHVSKDQLPSNKDENIIRWVQLQNKSKKHFFLVL